MRMIVGLAVLLLGVTALPAQVVQHGLKVPAGFEVVEYSDNQLANDIITMTINPRGQIVVAGPGYIRILVDDGKGGKAAKAIDVQPAPKDAPQALLWEGDHLYFMSDGGLRRLPVDANSKATGPVELIRAMKTGGEHHAHAIRRGPDGWLYVLCGNTTGIDKSYATLATSPIKDPVAGCVVRFSPDLKQSEIVADGLRNAYDCDFNVDGELFTYDSDNERCVALPWYEPTRFYHVIPGGHYGWRSPQHGTFFRYPPYFPDVVAPLTTLGRGSPTGVACYRHVQFPEKYRGGFFLADWTFGRIYFAPLTRAGASYKTTAEVFLESVGENGFAPTAVAVHPTSGDLFISIGGRGTRGAVYRVRYPAGAKIDSAELAKMKPAARALDWRDDYVQQAVKGDDAARLQALVAMNRHVSRATGAQIRDAIHANWDCGDPAISRVVVSLIGRLLQDERRQLGMEAKSSRQRLAWCLACYATDPAEVALAIHHLDASVDLGAARVLQLAVGDIGNKGVQGSVFEGYSRQQEKVHPAYAKVIRDVTLENFGPDGLSDRTAHEITRLVAMAPDLYSGKRDIVAKFLTTESTSIDDIHFLSVLGRLNAHGADNITGNVARALLSLDQKVVKEKLQRDRHWPLRAAEIHAALAAKDPKLNDALLAHKDFGRPDHALFTRAPGFDRKKAAAIFLARAEKDSEYPWNGDLVALIGELPPAQALPVLRKLWDGAGLEDAILPVLAKHPDAADRAKFLHGLSSPQQATVRLSLEALAKLPEKDVEPPHLLALVLALRRVGDSKEEKALAEQLTAYLQRLTGQKLPTDKQAWTDWFAKAHPTLAARLAGPDGVDVAAWTKRLSGIDWNAGNSDRGGKIFTKANCASCHSGAQALGPDLHGVANRFSRVDLLTAILQPSKDIASRYRTTQVLTANGKIHQGLVVYESTDSMIIQTGPTAAVRLDGTQIASKRLTDISLMPAGLLDMLKDEEIADLYAYLKGLNEKK